VACLCQLLFQMAALRRELQQVAGSGPAPRKVMALSSVPLRVAGLGRGPLQVVVLVLAPVQVATLHRMPLGLRGDRITCPMKSS
jgi:hypothetical protein